MKTIVLIGGSGFLGKSLLPQLLDEKFHVKALVHKTEIDYPVEKFYGDISNSDSLKDKIHDDDIVINLSGQYENNLTEFIDTNIMGGLNLLNSCVSKKNMKIILISSVTVYGENLEQLSKESDIPKPSTMYGLIKLITEQIYLYYSKHYGLDITVLRLSTLYGPLKQTGYIAKLIKSINENKTNVAYNNGQQIRDLLLVGDATKGIIQAIKKQQNGFNVFNISSGKRYSINEIIEIIEKISHKKLSIVMSPDVPDEKCLSADNSLAKKLLDFEPTTKIEDGLKLTIDYFAKKSN
ncbi:MAG: NAD-dependent epimerase/dehydratase family protein [Nitrosotalea sp.]